MKNKKVGYVRVSSVNQNTIRQDVLMEQLGVDIVFTEKVSGKSVTNRPMLSAMFEELNPGDTVIVESISRFARNTKDLLELIERLKKKGVDFISKKESVDTNTDTGKFMLTIFGAVAELERAYIKDRQIEGINIAKEQGKFKGRKKIEHRNFEAIYRKWKSKKINAVEAMKLLNMKPNTFYRRVGEYEAKKSEDL